MPDQKIHRVFVPSDELTALRKVFRTTQSFLCTIDGDDPQEYDAKRQAVSQACHEVQAAKRARQDGFE